MIESQWKSDKISNGVLNNKVIVIIPFYNAATTIQDAILSVLEQDFDDLGIIIRDDCSTDDSQQVIRKIFNIGNEGSFYLKNTGRDVVYIENTKKLYAGGNTYESVMKLVKNQQSIIGIVDGDDYLLTIDAISSMHHAYINNPNKWLIWSQHASRERDKWNLVGYSKPVPADEVIYANRKYWAISHFRTCLAGLFHLLDPKDLMDPLNPDVYAKVCGDASFLYPILEMCGNRRSMFLNKMLYYYNDGIPSNDYQVYRTEIEFYRSYFENKEQYKQLDAAFHF